MGVNRMKRRTTKLLHKLKELKQEAVEKDHSASFQKQITENFSGCDDLVQRTFPELNITIIYFLHMVNENLLEMDLLVPIYHASDETRLPFLKRSNFHKTDDEKKVIDGILNGEAAVFHHDHAYLINISGPKQREIQPSETETTITGPHEGFVESSEINLSMIRRRVKSAHLKMNEIPVGEVSKGSVFVLHIKGIANDEVVGDMINRIEKIEIDAVYDAHMLTQLIEDQPNALFPQFMLRERPDAIAAALVEGKIVVVVDGSPSVIISPSSFFDFFQTGDDYYQRWITGTATRLLRFGAFIITIGFTALYVSVTTFQYEMIPQSLLTTLAGSRSKVPFNPLYEALIMEITLEFLREAGARLPTKVGQTIGIVGGIVIGQAAVQAGITSNVLIIVVASSAITSFVVPSYVMSASIRLARFGLILLAGLLGNLGIVIGVILLVIHLSSLTSAGAPYLAPLSPFFRKDWVDFLLRAPYSLMKTRPALPRTSNKKRKQ
ncbi:spore germination protein [Bacillus hwajinpoensis]|uniref:Spore germination protein n=2 Tax=Guptibacillus hwajinpoensis TaxID=208199 RepID=A0A845F1S7_9BACL|nr:spore germination protein [Pseudalkalibacillus hwajinpoensis]